VYGADNIIDKTLKAFQDLKYCMDGCWDSAGPSMIISTEPIRKALKELTKRGIRLRYLTDINKDNFQYCKMMAEDGINLRHLAGVKSNFSIMDSLEYQATIITREERPLIEAIVSNLKTFVEGQQSLFETLWNNALPAEKRIREIEEELGPGFIKSISDPYEIEKIAFDLVKSAKDEVIVLFSTANAFKRQERAGLIRLLQETNSTVTVRILMPALELEKSVKGRFDENQRIKVQYFDSSLQTNLSKLVVDKKFALVVEIKDDTKDDPYEAIGKATYSNQESIVLIHDSMFEVLWVQTELYQTNRTK
jgi:two-component system, OmpR family, sensor histidine kinase VicK